ncbi:serine hydrolase domain-containing protein [Aestuariibacter salexigens]|uniref:serine hydrolase domain-containing protein n=1 Tax=Aestuariibacter salexigens TaxID=226010 RepID=UPI00040E0086|nr:serine hydrolase [Aestuariibacter salexigens]
MFKKQKGNVLANAVFLLFAVTATAACADKQSTEVLDGNASDATVIGWMQGFPPAKDKRITQPDSNFFSFPKLRWSVCHMQELLPTATIKRDPYAYRPLPYKLLSSIDDVAFMPLDSQTSMTWKQSLSVNYTDGLLILHNGHIVYEYYSGCLTPHTLHAAMSMTKSITGLLAEILIAEKYLDEQQNVSEVVPELAGSAFADATVRQVMDMTTSLDYSENYADPQADIWKYSYAANPLPKPADYQGPIGYYEYLQTVRKKDQHGQIFGYKTVNSDVLGWILSRVTGLSYQQLVSRYLWQRVGTEHDGLVTVDGLGTAFAGGGISATLRDLARIGQLMLQQGRIDGVQLIPAQAIQSIQQGGDKSAFAKSGYTSLPNASYKSMWWVFHNKHGAYAARGVHGQTIYIDQFADMVIVRLASHPSAGNAANDPTSLPAYQAVAEHLIKQGTQDK